MQINALIYSNKVDNVIKPVNFNEHYHSSVRVILIIKLKLAYKL